MSRSSVNTGVCVAGAVLLATAFVSAQDTSQPVSQPVFGRSDPLGSFHFDRPSMTLTLESIYARADNGNASSSDLTFREMLDVSTHGYLYDPAFIDLSLEGAFGLSQSTFDSTPGASGTATGTLYTYDARMTVLSQKPATLTLYAQQTDNFINQSYAPTIEAKASSYGMDLNLQSTQVPTVLRAYHTEQTQTSLGGWFDQGQDYSLKQDTFEWRSQATGNNQTFNWLYAYNHVVADSPATGTTQYDSQLADLVYTRTFGPGNLSTWTTALSYYGQTGDFTQQRMRGETDVTLSHSSTFETFAGYLIDSSEVDNFTTTLQKVTGGFRHYLWGSLTTIGRIGANSLSDDSGALSREEYADLSFLYTKQVPMGQLGANLSLRADTQQNEARSQPFHVVDEPYTFADPVPIVISRRNIIPSSILITDSTHTRIYTEGVDYTTLWFPTYVQILRAAGGVIPSNAAVLVDYSLLPQSQSTINTYTLNTGARYDFTRGPLNGLGVYGQYLLQDQSVQSEDSTFPPDQIHDVTLGLDYHVGDWSLNAEYEHHDSTVTPFDAWRTGAQYSRRLNSAMVFAANANYVMYRYDQPQDQLSILTTSASVDYQFSQHLSATATAGWFRQDDQMQGNTTGTEGSLGLQWYYGMTQVYVNVRAIHLDTDTHASDFQMLQIGLTRKF